MKMTFDQYDKLEEKMSELGYPADGYWPSVKDLEKKLNPKNKHDIEFLIWLLSINPEPVTEEDCASKKKINEILYSRLELIEE